jgi:hypothetical protein
MVGCFGKALAGDRVDAAIWDAANTSWPFLRSRSTVLEPISPVPPMTTIFMTKLLVRVSALIVWLSHQGAGASAFFGPDNARELPAQTIDRKHLSCDAKV